MWYGGSPGFGYILSDLKKTLLQYISVEDFSKMLIKNPQQFLSGNNDWKKGTDDAVKRYVISGMYINSCKSWQKRRCYSFPAEDAGEFEITEDADWKIPDAYKEAIKY